MKLILDIEAPDGTQKQVWMGVDEILHIGSSSQMDVSLEMDRSLLSEHFSISGSRDGWEVRVSPGARLSLNGLPCSRQWLKHGDLLQAGQSEFQVTLEGAITRPLAETIPSQQVAKTEERHAEFRREPMASGVTRFDIKQNQTSATEILQAVVGKQHAWAIVNQRRLKKELGLSIVSEDLFARAPDEIRSTDSLFIAQFKLVESEISPILDASRAQAAIIAVAEASLEETLKAQSLVWAWYSRPSILSQQLSVGSKHLAEKLMSAINTVVLADNALGQIVLFVRSEKADATNEILKALVENTKGQA